MKARVLAVLMCMGVFLSSFLAFPSNADNQHTKPALKIATVEQALKINLNQADENVLLQSFKEVKGVGKQRVLAIISYREEHKKFNSLEELAKVKGFSDKFVKANLQQLESLFTLE